MLRDIYTALQTQALEVRKTRGRPTVAIFPTPAAAYDFKEHATNEEIWVNPIQQPLHVQANQVWFIQ